MATKRQQQAQDTRQKIVDTAQRLFGEKGYMNTTIEDIATACGIGKGTMYHYFAGKEAIFSYIERGHFSEVKQTVDALALPTTAQRLRQFVLAWFACVAQDNLKVSKDWHSLAVNLKVPSAENRTHLDDDIDNITAYLQGGIAAGELRPDMPVAEVARDLVFSMYGASFYRCSSYTAFDIEAWGRQFVDRALPLHLTPYYTKQANEEAEHEAAEG